MRTLLVLLLAAALVLAIGCGQKSEQGADKVPADVQKAEMQDSTRMDSAAMDTMAADTTAMEEGGEAMEGEH
jgi:PBP1b-binding outer membrane lipoprotein LpoB